MISKIKSIIATLIIATLAIIVSCSQSSPQKTFTIGNAHLERTLQTSKSSPPLKTLSISNKISGKTSHFGESDEFQLRISEGTHVVGTDIILTAKDFVLKKVEKDRSYASEHYTDLTFFLDNTEHGISLEVHYSIKKDQPWVHKWLVISSGKKVAIERIDVESLNLEDVYQPYKTKQITSKGSRKWRTGLGQPLYTSENPTFWGIEFPAADNYVEKNNLYCGYLWGLYLEPLKPYTTYKAVCGVGDNPDFIQDTFFEYIHTTRARPSRLQIQYNSWFDFGGRVNKTGFTSSVKKINHELVEKRGNQPLQAYVIDDGWQNNRTDWSGEQGVWQVDTGDFDSNFETSKSVIADANSTLGLWLSPGCIFGGTRAIAKMKAAGWESLDPWMSLAGPKYMGALEKRLLELTEEGVSYWKFDGLFGHLNDRNFELNGQKYGIPYMPQLGLEGVSSSDKILNDPKYDELKIYYLTAGSVRLMKIFKEMGEINPDVYIVISNGAWLSPWWLHYVDSIWMINAGDAARGSNRTQELVYRDGVYQEIYAKDQTQFPPNDLFNHEPKKVKTGETPKTFRHYLYMNISRGTRFIELYLKTPKLKDYDWDVLSEGLHWSYHIFPTFHRSRIYGGNPKRDEVYGYTGWTSNQGYISIHNPSRRTKTYTIILDRKFGLVPNSGNFYLSSPIETSTQGLAKTYQYADTLKLTLKPREIRILNFDKEQIDWTVQRKLQIAAETSYGVYPEKTEIAAAILGRWYYTHRGRGYSREFTQDGFCILRQGEKQIWKKSFTVIDESTVRVGSDNHVLAGENLKIANTYLAEKK